MSQRIPPSEADEVHYVRDEPQCFFCAHFRGEGTCAAFPKEIPFVIYTNQADHRKPYPGDHGIQFQSIPGAEDD